MRRFEIERAVLRAQLPAPSVAIMLVLCTRMSARDGAIPRDHQPSLTWLAEASGQDRRTVMRHLAQLEAAGWLARDRPRRADAARYHITTAYDLAIPGAYQQARGTHSLAPGAHGPRSRGAGPPGPGAGHAEARGAAPHSQRETGEGQTSSGTAGDDLATIAQSELAALTGRQVPARTAAEAVRLILDGRQVRNPAAYLRRALRADPARYAPAPSGPPPFRELRERGEA